MARGRQTIAQRIVLEGAELIKKELQSIGKAGADAFKEVQNSANKPIGKDLSGSVRKLQSDVKALGMASKDAVTQAGGVEKVSMAFENFAKVLQRAVAGEKQAAGTLRLLGVEFKDAQGKIRPAGQVLTEVAEKFSKMPDSGIKAQLAVRLFGREVVGLVPFLNQGRQGIEALAQGLLRSGGVGQAFGVAMGVARVGVIGLGVAVAALTVAAVPALAALAKSGAAAAEEIRKAARDANISTRDYQRLGHVARQTGSDHNALTSALGALEKKLGEAAGFDKLDQALGRTGASARKTRGDIFGVGVQVRELSDFAKKTGGDVFGVGVKVKAFGDEAKKAEKNTSDLAQTFLRLGIDFEKFIKLSPIDQLKRLADAFKAFPDGAQERNLAESLGFSAATLETLNKGGAAIDELVKQSDALGRSLSETQIKAGEEYTRAMDDLGAAVGATKDQFGLLIAQEITPWIKDITAATDEGRKGFLDWTKGLIEGIKNLDETLLNAQKNVRDSDFAKSIRDGLTIKPPPDELKGFFQGLLDGAREFGREFDKLMQDTFSRVNQDLGISSAKAADDATGNLSGIGADGTLQGISQRFRDQFAQVKADAVETVNFVNQQLQSVGGASAAAEGQEGTSGGGFDGLKTGAQQAFDEIRQKATEAAGGIRDEFANLTVDFSGLSSGAQGAASEIKSPLVEAVNEIKAKFAEIPAAVAEAMAQAVSNVQQAAAQMVAALRDVEAQIRAVAQAAAAAASSGGGGGGSNADGFAAGGLVRGPGTSTSDSIRAWLSDKEFVMQAKAVRKYGVAFMQAINEGRLKLPKFATGGLVSAPQLKLGLPAFSTGGLVDALSSSLAALSPSSGMSLAGMGALAPAGSSGRPVNISLGGETFGLTGPDDVVERLARAATGQQLRSAGRKPGWY